MYANRQEAGQALAARLATMVGERAAIVIALPRGGVPVAAEIARRLRAPLDLCYVRKIGAPNQPELAIGAVADGVEPRVVLNRKLIADLGVPEAYMVRAANRELAEIERQRNLYQPGRRPPKIAGQTVVLVDDGLATGTTARAALRAIRAAGAARVILAVPVAHADTLAALASETDAVVCPRTPASLSAVGEEYREFPQVTDQQVVALLLQAADDTGAREAARKVSENDAIF